MSALNALIRRSQDHLGYFYNVEFTDKKKTQSWLNRAVLFPQIKKLIESIKARSIFF